MVALSPRCSWNWASRFGGRPARPYVKSPAAKGLGVKATTSWTSSSPRLWRKWHRATRRLRRKEQKRVPARSPSAPALLLLKVHADFGDRFRFSGGAELRGEPGRTAICPVRARTFCASSRARREPPRFADGTEPRSHGAPASVGRFLAGAAGRVQGRFRGGGSGGRRRAGARGQVRVSNWRRRSTTFITSTPSFTRKTARRRFSCCG